MDRDSKIIRMENVSYTYPFQNENAIKSFSMEVGKGEAILLTGASGCGKSTIIRLINGLAPHFFGGTVQGRVIIDGKDTRELRLHELASKVGTLFQDPEQQFFTLNASDEIAFAHECRQVAAGEIESIVSGMIDHFKLRKVANSSILNLSDGEKQKVALASIVSLKPDVIVLDEPTANLDPEAARELASLLKKLKDEGVTLIIADHRLYWLKDLVDRVYVFRNGELCESGDYTILSGSELRAEYGLRRIDAPDVRSSLPQAKALPGSPHISARHLYFSYNGSRPIYENLCVSIPFGKVTALLGSNGAGKTTLARLLCGLSGMNSGSIVLDGGEVRPKQLLKKSSIIFQNTDHQLHMKSVRRELEIAARRLKKSEREKECEAMAERFGLQNLMSRHPQSLSGGQKQRLTIACGVIKRPDILILDEPTSGLDGANLRIMADTIRSEANRGACVLVISHDLELLHASCDFKLDVSDNGAGRPGTEARHV